MTSATHFISCLSSEGNTIRISNMHGDGANKIPEQAKALACRTHQAVLDFLQELKKSKNQDYMFFSHEHNPNYSEHLGVYRKCSEHHCPLDAQIEFVRCKIREQEQGIQPKKPITSCCVIM